LNFQFLQSPQGNWTPRFASQQVPHHLARLVGLSHANPLSREIQIENIFVGRDLDSVLKRGDSVIELAGVDIEYREVVDGGSIVAAQRDRLLEKSPRGRRAVSYCNRILCMPRGNPSPKLAITVNPDIHKNILAAAARDGVSVSVWMTAAAREALQRRAGLAAVAHWEEQHGPFTGDEINEARSSVRAQFRTVRRPA
jgi:hypothetical protein